MADPLIYLRDEKKKTIVSIKAKPKTNSTTPFMRLPEYPSIAGTPKMRPQPIITAAITTSGECPGIGRFFIAPSCRPASLRLRHVRFSASAL
ncbi:hypothetical protein [Brevundimonas sp.]|uniref:hypothetical protein n=1 Tax=Brevundimonas sp. TaxID=1871086 RepID=UPI0035144DD4